MAKNDRFLVDGIIDDRVAARLPSNKRDEVLEYLAFEQVLKDLDLSSDELLSGLVDGRQDGGIDGFFILVNGHVLQDPDSFNWPKIGSDLRIYLFLCKSHDTFKQATIDAVIATLSELLDFGVEDSKLQGAYSSAFLKRRSCLRYAYRKLSQKLSNFCVDVYYVSRGDTTGIGTEVSARAGQAVELVKDCFGSCKSQFYFIGCAELISLHRKVPNFTLEVPYVESLANGERYVVLVKLSDYFRFISDEFGKLRRHLFESNVRDFMGLNRVNEDIQFTLRNRESPDFWLLNNGVTVLASSASITGRLIQASGIQIVNGLQTTESIYRHFSSSKDIDDERCLLVKIIVTDDAEMRDAIIRATNNQTDVELSSLHATDKIQRDIEDAFLKSGLFYERRKNFYINLGHPLSEIVTPLYVASGYLALVLKVPERAATLKSKFLRDSVSYDAVFSNQVPLDVWPKIARILKLIDAELEVLRPRGKSTDKFLKGWRYIIALFLVSRSVGKFTFSPNDIIAYETKRISAASVREIWDELNLTVPWDRIGRGWLNPKNVVAACKRFALNWGISGIEMILARNIPPHGKSQAFPITEKFLERLQAVIPPQPWKAGIHKQISRELGCQVSTVSAAIKQLIEKGIFYRQENGILFDLQGNIVSFTPKLGGQKSPLIANDDKPS